jgi:hypothetical protein
MFRNLFQTVSLLSHETFLEDGHLKHNANCLRCKLQAQIADLHAQVRLFAKTVDDFVGSYPSGARIDKAQ